MRRINWAHSKLKRAALCGRVTWTPDASTGVRSRLVRAGRWSAGFVGLQTCGSVWACPVCSAKIQAERRAEIAQAVRSWEARGGRVLFGTATLSHRAADGLRLTWDGIRDVWGSLINGKPWAKAKARYGVEHWLKVVEVTTGANGWHVHVHYLLFVAGDLGAAGVRELGAWISERWARAAARKGHTARSIGQDLRALDKGAHEDLAAYLAKAELGPERIGWELTGAQSKAARDGYGTQPVWSLYDRLTVDGDADALDLIHEWQAASKGRRQMTWSRGAREAFGLGVERTDEEIAATEMGTEEDTWFILPVWAQLRDLRKEPELLNVVESGQGDRAPARRWLNEHGIEWKEWVR